MPTDNRPSQSATAAAADSERPLICKHCGGFIATHTAKRLSIGASAISQPVEVICGYCRAKVFWGPQSVARFQGRLT